jgi:putative intracellular protease/amidase
VREHRLNSAERQVYHVYVVVLPDALLLDVAGPAEALRCANLYGSQVHFDVRFVGPQELVRSSTGLVLGEIAPLPEALEDDAILVLAGMRGDFDHKRNVDVLATVRWLERIAPSASRIVCVCSGALVAAVAGLLRGRSCTTHHSLIGDLRRLDSSATILDNRLYVQDEHVYTSAGVTSGTDLMLAIVSELAGPVVASKSARSLVVYTRRAAGDRKYLRGSRAAITSTPSSIAFRTKSKAIRFETGRCRRWRISLASARDICLAFFVNTWAQIFPITYKDCASNWRGGSWPVRSLTSSASPKQRDSDRRGSFGACGGNSKALRRNVRVCAY